MRNILTIQQIFRGVKEKQLKVIPTPFKSNDTWFNETVTIRVECVGSARAVRSPKLARHPFGHKSQHIYLRSEERV